MSENAEITLLENLRQQVASLTRFSQSRERARDEAIRQLDMATEKAGYGQSLPGSDVKALIACLRETDREADAIYVDQAKIIDNTMELTKLREKCQRLTEQLAEVNEFRAKLKTFLQGA
ncbi:MAG: hypothetical protein R3F10_03505 [Lysobacteraceae bacterium]